MKNCCLCNAELINEYGCNPAPLADAGSCCNKCDNLKVVPARLVELGTPRSSADSIGKTFWKIHTSRVWKKMIKDGLLKEVK